MEIINVSNLTKTYGDNQNNTTVAVDDISLKIEKGEFTAIMGPSGSGKSTLVSMLSGILKPTGGNIEIEGKKISDMDKNELAMFRRQRLGFVFQDFNLMNNLTIKENIILPMVFDKAGKQTMDEKAERYMKQFGIMELADKYPGEVSGGQMQRTAVARALVNDPTIIFADEPTGNLDSKSSKAVMNCLKKINEEMGTTILMVTHDTFAASFCKHVIFVKDGHINMDIVKKGNRNDFFNRILECQAAIGGESYDL